MSVLMKGAGLLQKRITGVQLQITRNKDHAARAAANVIKVAIREQSPKHSGGGRHKLRSSVRVAKFSGGYVVGPTAFFARLVIKGHKAPHQSGHSPIAPRNTGAATARFNRRGRQGPMLGKLAISFNGIARATSPGGAASANPYVDKAYQIAKGEARGVAGMVIFHNAPDPNEGA